METCHIIGNGDSASMWNPKAAKGGLIMTCNLPPFPVRDVYATAIVDFKMMKAIQEGSVVVPGDWVLGKRPQIHMERHPSMYIKYASQIREFYTTIPDYIVQSNGGDVSKSYTDFSCGHMAAHYMCAKFRPGEVHLYGFDSIFNFDLRSASDMYLWSERNHINTVRLTNNWRKIWPAQFAEFPSIKFVLHGAHKDLKIGPVGSNVEIFVQ